jgi:alkylhydroperoxidase/carboxymuconolactone decarboxylase family protein YurZ
VVAALLEDGASEDEVFEMTVAAAFGAARERFDAGLRALREAKALPDVGGA